MGTIDEARLIAEAGRTVASRSGGVSRHDRALQQYLTGTQYAPTRPTAAPDGSPAPDNPTGVGPDEAETADARQPEAVSATDETDCPPGAVVVGIDDGDSSDAALDWAADEAERRAAPLHLVHTYLLPTMAWQPEYRLYAGDLLERVRVTGAARLADAERHVLAGRPNLAVYRTLAHARPAQALRRVSEDARVTVVGHGPASRGARALLGSVSLSVVSDCPAPVVVVGPDVQRREGPVVVGFDGSPTSRAAVGVAFDEAAVSGEELIVLHAWNDVDRDANRLHQLTDTARFEEQERARLSEQLTGWQQRHPDVVAHTVVDHDRPATALLHYSTHASLVVVGTRGRGGLAGMLLGSTSHTLASYGSCPIMVVGDHSGRPGSA